MQRAGSFVLAVLVACGVLIAGAAVAVSGVAVTWKVCNVTEVVAPPEGCAPPAPAGLQKNCSADLNIPCSCGGRCVSAAPCVSARASLGSVCRDCPLSPYPAAEHLCLNGAPECRYTSDPAGRAEAYREAAVFADALRANGEIACYEQGGGLHTEVGDHTGVVVVLGILSFACFSIAYACSGIEKRRQRSTLET